MRPRLCEHGCRRHYLSGDCSVCWRLSSWASNVNVRFKTNWLQEKRLATTRKLCTNILPWVLYNFSLFPPQPTAVQFWNPKITCSSWLVMWKWKVYTMLETIAKRTSSPVRTLDSAQRVSSILPVDKTGILLTVYVDVAAGFSNCLNAIHAAWVASRPLLKNKWLGAIQACKLMPGLRPWQFIYTLSTATSGIQDISRGLTRSLQVQTLWNIREIAIWKVFFTITLDDCFNWVINIYCSVSSFLRRYAVNGAISSWSEVLKGSYPYIAALKACKARAKRCAETSVGSGQLVSRNI